MLQDEGIETYVVDPTSIATSRRRRRAKTDKIDGEALVRALLAYKRGEPRVCAMVRAPSVAEEDQRRLNRERSVLIGRAHPLEFFGEDCPARRCLRAEGVTLMSEELTPLERAVVALSRSDSITSLRPPSRRLGWILAWPTSPLPLANPRLEALRRHAVLCRVHGAARVEAERAPLRDAGFSSQTIEEIDDLIDPSRSAGASSAGRAENLLVFDGSCFPAVRWN